MTATTAHAGPHTAAGPVPMQRIISLEQPVSWQAVALASSAPRQVRLECSAERWRKIQDAFDKLGERIERDRVQVYGVTTGFGEGARKSLSASGHHALQSNLLSYLDCSLGELASPKLSRATLLLRIVSLAQGYSAVSPAMLERLIAIYNAGYAPAIPLQGSLGASGDLIPLASVGQCMRGIGEVYAPDDTLVAATEMLKTMGHEPFVFERKDSLGLVNGTALMTAMACLAIEEFGHLLEWTLHSIGGLLLSLRAHPAAFSELVNERAKAHPGQSHVAAHIRELTAWQEFDFAPKRDAGHHHQSLQDSYSLRCTPQVLGPVFEIFEQAKAVVEREINSCNDNPLVDPETGAIASGGNFYGGSIAMIMDQVAWAGAHVADLLDRQTLLAVHDHYNRGLPADLTGARADDDDAGLSHHGLKGLHQHASALTSEIVRLAVPASVFSRSAESHNQDKISLGTHAARNVMQQLELIGSLVSLHSVCAAQALSLRDEVSTLTPPLSRWFARVREHVPFVREDRRMRDELLALRDAVRSADPS